MSVVTEALNAQRDEWAECIREATQRPGLIEAIKAPQEPQEPLAKMIRNATPLGDMLRAQQQDWAKMDREAMSGLTGLTRNQTGPTTTSDAETNTTSDTETENDN
jgi:hypothetical protein